MNCATAARNSRCCLGLNRSQSRQNEASTSRVGIERLRALVQRGQEIVVVLEPSHSTGNKILVSLALTLLPFLSPEPCLLGVDPAIGDLLKQNHGTINCSVGEPVDKVMEVSLRHIRILTAANGVHQPASERCAVISESHPLRSAAGCADPRPAAPVRWSELFDSRRIGPWVESAGALSWGVAAGRRKAARGAEPGDMDDASKRGRRERRLLVEAEHVRDAFGLVLALVLLTYVLTSLLGDRGWESVVISLATSATSVVALTSAHVEPRRVRTAVWVSGITVLMAAIGAVTHTHLWLAISSAVQVLLLAVAMAAVLRRVIANAGADSRTILGAISVYTVLGLFFTFIYVFVGRVQDSPFFEGHPHASGSDFIFFSYTTLTTTGYGDLVPGGQPGRMLAGLEMMVGQVFLVTLVAGLVALWRPGERFRRRREGNGAAAGEGAVPPDATP